MAHVHLPPISAAARSFAVRLVSPRLKVYSLFSENTPYWSGPAAVESAYETFVASLGQLFLQALIALHHYSSDDDIHIVFITGPYFLELAFNAPATRPTLPPTLFSEKRKLEETDRRNWVYATTQIKELIPRSHIHCSYPLAPIFNYHQDGSICSLSDDFLTILEREYRQIECNDVLVQVCPHPLFRGLFNSVNANTEKRGKKAAVRQDEEGFVIVVSLNLLRFHLLNISRIL